MIVHLDFHSCCTNEILSHTFNGIIDVLDTENGDVANDDDVLSASTGIFSGTIQCWPVYEG